MKKLTPTEEMLKHLQQAEDILAVLDQNAKKNGPALARACSRFYDEALKIRDEELIDWNNDASASGCQIFRCDEAQLPYDDPYGGRCDVFTTNASGSAHVCDTHIARAERGSR